MQRNKKKNNNNKESEKREEKKKTNHWKQDSIFPLISIDYFNNYNGNLHHTLTNKIILHRLGFSFVAVVVVVLSSRSSPGLLAWFRFLYTFFFLSFFSLSDSVFFYSFPFLQFHVESIKQSKQPVLYAPDARRTISINAIAEQSTLIFTGKTDFR